MDAKSSSAAVEQLVTRNTDEDDRTGGERPADVGASSTGLELRQQSSNKSRDGTASSGGQTGETVAPSASDHPLVGPGPAGDGDGRPRQFKVYKRRWFALVQLSLLNIIVSWDWLTFSAVSSTSAEYFRVTENAINWLSTGFLFAFVAVSPIVLWTLNKGPKPAIIACAALVFVGNWIRYGGAKANRFGVVLFGQILIGFGQPFVLAAPTRLSDLWFTDRGRITATAVASLANPFGGALGQLMGPLWATKASDTPTLVLYVAIISTVASIPAFFIPAAPPTPPSASHLISKTPLQQTFNVLAKNATFWLIFIPFSVYVGFFNSLSSLLNQVLEPYGFSENQAGIGGGLLIIVGLIAAAITSPIVDRNHQFLIAIKTLVPIVAASYLAFVWMPQTRSLAGPYVVLSVLGAASFSLVPVALEYLVEVTFPASPEVTSVICWSGGQLLGALFIIIQSALKDNADHGRDRPKGNEYRALVFQACLSLAAMPPPILIGLKSMGLGGDHRRRFIVDEGRTSGNHAGLAER